MTAQLSPATATSCGARRDTSRRKAAVTAPCSSRLAVWKVAGRGPAASMFSRKLRLVTGRQDLCEPAWLSGTPQ